VLFSNDPNDPNGVHNVPVTVTCGSCNVPVDLDGDYDNDLPDFSILSLNWMQMGCMGPGWCGGTDINMDGKVDELDFILMAEFWLAGKSP